MHVFWNVDTNGMSEHWIGPEVARPLDAVAGDLDGDGNADLVLTDFDDSQIHVLPGAAEKLGDPVSIDSVPVERVGLGHFDGDALLDVAALSLDGLEISFHLGHAEALLGAGVVIAEEDVREESIAVGDLNDDGVDDLVFGDMHALISVP